MSQRPGSDQCSLAALEEAAARTQAATLDGVYCHCDCSKHAGHRSLLTCFEGEHGAYCDICMGEAMVASGMADQGRSLEEIRTAIDKYKDASDMQKLGEPPKQGTDGYP